MAKQRSPNYPGLSIQKALGKAEAVYRAEHTHPAPRDVVAKHLGYGSLNGSSLTAIGALNHYGLLEAAGEGLRVSDDAVTIFELPPTEVAHRQALTRCAFKPSLFEELRSQFGDKLPSEANLRHALIKKGFIPSAADGVIRVFRENLEVVGVAGNGYHEEEEPPMQAAQPNPALAQAPPPGTTEAGKTTDLVLPQNPGKKQEVFVLSGGSVVVQWPDSMSADDFQDIADWLPILERKIKRSIVKPDED